MGPGAAPVDMSDPTDPGGVGANAERSRSTRVGDSGSPVGSPLTIVLALIAVVVGFLIFRSIDDSDAGGIESPDGSTTVAAGRHDDGRRGDAGDDCGPGDDCGDTGHRRGDGDRRQRQRAGGVAQNMQDALDDAGYSVTAEATTDTNAENRSRTSSSTSPTAPPAIQAVAQSVARDLGGLTVQPMPAPIPVDGGSIGTATVFVMLGNDIAGESLEDLGGDAAPNVQAPAPAGGRDDHDLISAGSASAPRRIADGLFDAPAWLVEGPLLAEPLDQRHHDRSYPAFAGGADGRRRTAVGIGVADDDDHRHVVLRRRGRRRRRRPCRRGSGRRESPRR